MQFTFTNIYPDEIPLIQIASSYNIEEEDEKDLIACMQAEVYQRVFQISLYLYLCVHVVDYSYLHKYFEKCLSRSNIHAILTSI